MALSEFLAIRTDSAPAIWWVRTCTGKSSDSTEAGVRSAIGVGRRLRGTLVPCEEVPCHDSGTRNKPYYAKRLADSGSYAPVVLVPPSEQGSLADDTVGPLLMIIFLVRSHQFVFGRGRGAAGEINANRARPRARLSETNRELKRGYTGY